MRILEGNEWDSSMTVEGYAPPTPDALPEPYMNQISPNYFATLAVPIVAGRDFRVADYPPGMFGVIDTSAGLHSLADGKYAPTR